MELNKIPSDNGNQIRIGIFFIEPMQLMQLDHIRISSPFDARGNWSVATGVAEAGRCGVRLNHFEASTTCTISPVSYRIALSTAGMTCQAILPRLNSAGAHLELHVGVKAG